MFHQGLTPPGSPKTEMLQRLMDYWFPRLLFVASVGIALTLAGAVLVSPLLVDEESGMFWKLFAEDAVVRRIALISAAGLVVTAFLFFRAKAADPTRPPRQPPRTMAGA